MKLSTACRILSGECRRGTLRKKYWRWRAGFLRWVRLLRMSNRDFLPVVLGSHVRYAFRTVSRVEADTRVRAKAAKEWLTRAHDMTADDGVSAGYFPCEKDDGGGWNPSYPETTGYIIPTFLEYARWYGDVGIRARAVRMAVWETQIQLASGAVYGGYVCPPDEQEPVVFNTGMVLQGYMAVLREGDDTGIVESARAAADFLVGDQGSDGHFRTHGVHVAPSDIKTYNCLCAWPLYLFGEYTDEERYKEAAIRAVEAAVREQHENGWFANNSLDRSTEPLLHTIGYALQGILEVGILADREDFLEVARRGLDPIIAGMSRDGFLHGRYYSDWEPASFSSCLTGNAQIAVVSYRMFEQTRRDEYRSAADRILDFLKNLQMLDSPDDSLNGALAGSFPIMAHYQPAGYPNWATKYFLDGLMLQDRLSPRCAE